MATMTSCYVMLTMTSCYVRLCVTTYLPWRRITSCLSWRHAYRDVMLRHAYRDFGWCHMLTVKSCLPWRHAYRDVTSVEEKVANRIEDVKSRHAEKIRFVVTHWKYSRSTLRVSTVVQQVLSDKHNAHLMRNSDNQACMYSRAGRNAPWGKTRHPRVHGHAQL